MKKYHWWLTGPDDFPACAMLVNQTGSVEEIGQAIESVYKDLHKQKFSRGDPLQTAANILYLAKRPSIDIAHQFRQLADGFKNSGVSIWQSDYDELAILTFLKHEATHIVRRTLEIREELKKIRPKLDRGMSFNLAASIAFIDLMRYDENLKIISDAKALMDMQAIINAQNAAAVSAASSAAVAGST